jgi:hypothetical protein
MRFIKPMVVLAVLAIAASAYCLDLAGGIFSARQLGMGGAAVAVADDAYAWAQNPAGLPNLAPAAEEGRWAINAAGAATFSSTYGPFDDFNIYDLSASALAPDGSWGVGAGWGHEDEEGWGVSTGYGLGVGTKVKSESYPFNVGVSWFHVRMPEAVYVTEAVAARLVDDTHNLFNVGLMYDVQIPDHTPIRLGLLVQDVGDQLGRSWNFGVSFHAGPRLLIATDLDGLGSENRTWLAGAEYRLCDDWCARAGDFDGSLSLGAGYHHGNFYADYAHQQKNGEHVNVVTAGLTF